MNIFNIPESFLTVPNPRKKRSWPKKQACFVGMALGACVLAKPTCL